jgi:ADP-ribosylglycohydrolase
MGFITEMRDAAGVRRKISKERVDHPVAWERRVGGRFGFAVRLPVGCYSDDTQLRLATSRAIRSDGVFDAEAFAKVELPVWLSYHLGGGRATIAAARHLTRKDVAWYGNFYDERTANYVSSGGNGAAMRIQPHVWANASGRDREYRADVLRNALSTHGHARGFLGALFHADCLSHVMKTGQLPGPDAWLEMTRSFAATPSLVASDDNLSRIWLPTWESKVNGSLVDAIRRVQEEHEADIAAACSLLDSGEPETIYSELVNRLGGLARATLGSGTKTALLAAALAYLYKSRGAEPALIAAANQLGSDTDTIASMAGALLGLLEPADPQVPPADAEYLSMEARRLADMGQTTRQRSFGYPDLLHWHVPKSTIGSVGLAEEDIVLVGLGRVAPMSDPVWLSKRKDAAWQWMRLEFGQSVLVRRSFPLAPLPPQTWPASIDNRDARDSAEGKTATPRSIGKRRSKRDGGTQMSTMQQPNLFGGGAEGNVRPVAKRRIDELTTEVIESGFDPTLLGRQLLRVIDHSSTPIEVAVAFAAIIAKARAARAKNGPTSGPEET